MMINIGKEKFTTQREKALVPADFSRDNKFMKFVYSIIVSIVAILMTSCAAVVSDKDRLLPERRDTNMMKSEFVGDVKFDNSRVEKGYRAYQDDDVVRVSHDCKRTKGYYRNAQVSAVCDDKYIPTQTLVTQALHTRNYENQIRVGVNSSGDVYLNGRNISAKRDSYDSDDWKHFGKGVVRNCTVRNLISCINTRMKVRNYD